MKKKTDILISFALSLLITASSVFFSINLSGLIGEGLYIAAFVVVQVFNALTILFFILNKETLFKCAVAIQFIELFGLGIAYLLNANGVFKIVSSVAELRAYIETVGYAEWTYIAIQFMQAVFIPIPTTVTILAGILLFKPIKVVYLSLIGILPASALCFFIGRYAGRKIVDWIFSKSEVDKYLNLIKGKDKSVLTAMFLLPFFPDDTLCVVAGLSTMSFPYFMVVITITRIIMVFSNTYLMGGNIIPFRGWGLAVWAVLILAVVVLMFYLWKYGDVIDKKITELFGKRKGEKEEEKKE